MILIAGIAVALGIIKFMDPTFNRPNSKLAAACACATFALTGGSLRLIVRRTDERRFEDAFCVWLFLTLLSFPLLLWIVRVLLAVPIPFTLLGAVAGCRKGSWGS